MKVAIRTGGLLGKYLPQGSARNSAELELPEGTTATAVIGRLGMPSEGGYLVIHNGTAVPKDARGSCTLADGDELAIMPPLKGG
jgi:sulfur carrier protein ThiS